MSESVANIKFNDDHFSQPKIQQEKDLHYEIALLGEAISKQDTQKHHQIAKDVDGLHEEMIRILRPLKQQLTAMKLEHPNDEEACYDLSKMFDSILDFREIFERQQQAIYDTANNPSNNETINNNLKPLDDLIAKIRESADTDKPATITRNEISKLLSKVEDLEDDHKTETQGLSQKLYLQMNLSLTMFNILRDIGEKQAAHRSFLVRNQKG